MQGIKAGRSGGNGEAADRAGGEVERVVVRTVCPVLTKGLLPRRIWSKRDIRSAQPALLSALLGFSGLSLLTNPILSRKGFQGAPLAIAVRSESETLSAASRELVNSLFPVFPGFFHAFILQTISPWQPRLAFPGLHLIAWL